jgi:hypothetical protein
MNPFRRIVYPKFDKFGLTVSPLYYRPRLREDDISNLLKKEVAWKEGSPGKQKKHFDCLAEPFTNYIREHRLGYSRRVGQYSQMIRLGDMTREEALQNLNEEKPDTEPETTSQILEKLDISREEFNHIQYDKYCYPSTKFMKLVGRLLK